jgi:hypothetical protein
MWVLLKSFRSPQSEIFMVFIARTDPENFAEQHSTVFFFIIVLFSSSRDAGYTVFIFILNQLFRFDFILWRYLFHNHFKQSLNIDAPYIYIYIYRVASYCLPSSIRLLFCDSDLLFYCLRNIITVTITNLLLSIVLILIDNGASKTWTCLRLRQNLLSWAQKTDLIYLWVPVSEKFSIKTSCTRRNISRSSIS